jgi:hypothetical protein
VRHPGVEQRLVPDVRRRTDRVRQRRAEPPQSGDRVFALVDRAGVAHSCDHYGLPVDRRRQEWGGWGRGQHDNGHQLIGRRRHELPVGFENLARPGGRVEHHAGQDGRADQMQAILERRHHAEVAAAAAETPEEVGMLIGAGTQELPVSSDHVGREQVVYGEPVPTHQPAQAPAESETSDPRVRHDAARSGEAEGLGLTVDLTPKQSWLRARGPRDRIDPEALHRGQIDDDSAIARRRAGNIVAAAAHGDDELPLAGEPHGGPDVGDAGAARDEHGAAVDGTVPDSAGDLVLRIACADQLAAKLSRELGEGSVVQHRDVAKVGVEHG